MRLAFYRLTFSVSNTTMISMAKYRKLSRFGYALALRRFLSLIIIRIIKFFN